MVFDPTYTDINLSSLKEYEWKKFYAMSRKTIHGNTHSPIGKDAELILFIYSDHAGDTVTQKSRTWIFTFLNITPVSWYSKKKSTIETSVFSTEFVAMKVGMETVRGLRYNICMIGIPSPKYINGDKMSVIHNIQRSGTTLKKNSNHFYYHTVNESVAMGESLTGHIIILTPVHT